MADDQLLARVPELIEEALLSVSEACSLTRGVFLKPNRNVRQRRSIIEKILKRIGWSKSFRTGILGLICVESNA